jgi:hypothetical protein
MKRFERVQRALENDESATADRAPRGGPAAAEALRQLRRRGEAQMGHAGPTAVWRKPSPR